MELVSARSRDHRSGATAAVLALQRRVGASVEKKAVRKLAKSRSQESRLRTRKHGWTVSLQTVRTLAQVVERSYLHGRRFPSGPHLARTPGRKAIWNLRPPPAAAAVERRQSRGLKRLQIIGLSDPAVPLVLPVGRNGLHGLREKVQGAVQLLLQPQLPLLPRRLQPMALRLPLRLLLPQLQPVLPQWGRQSPLH